MKQTILTTAAMLGLLIGLAMTAGAQAGKRVDATIPFDFVAGELKLKAGEYSVKRISNKSLLLRSADNKTNAIVLAPISIEQRHEGSPERLVFKRYGNEYFLAQIWPDRNADGYALFPTKAEERLAKQMKKSNSAPQTIEIVSRRK